MREVQIALKEYLNDRGISQAHVSRESGIQQDLLWRALNGRRKMSITEYIDICRAIKQPPEDVMKELYLYISET